MRWLVVLVGLALLGGLVVASPVGAVETRSGEEVVIGPDEVVEDDIYVFANEVVVDGTIEGDLVTAGSNVIINGVVEGDVIAAGQLVEITGTVDDDVRMAGLALLLGDEAEVGGHVLAASYSLESGPGSIIEDTLIYAGYQALLSGSIDEDLSVTANALELDGEVGGDVNAEVDGDEGGPSPSTFVEGVEFPELEPGLTLTEAAVVGGDLTYESSTEARIAPNAQVGGEVVRSERPAEEEEEPRTALDRVLDHLRSFLALLLVGLLLVWLAPASIRGLAGTVRARPLLSLGWGLLGFAIFAVLALVILLVTVLLAVVFGLLTLGGLVGLIVVLGLVVETVLGIVFWFSVSYLAQIVVSFLVGVLLLERLRGGRPAGRVLPLLVGLILYVLLVAIPVLGALVGLVVVLLGFGALCYRIWTGLRRRRAVAPPAG